MVTSIEQTPPGTAGVDRLKPNAVGLTGVVFMVVATAAPIAAMTGNVPVAVGYGNGVGAPAGFLFATVVLTLFSIGYVAMARHITATGAFYGFISHGLGRVLGMASGALALLAYVVFEAGLIGLVAFLADSAATAQLGLEAPWQLYAVAALALNAVLAYYDVSIAARVLGVLLVCEVSLLAVMAVSVLFSGGGPDGIPFEPVNPLEAFAGAAPGLGLFFAFWSWVGFESTAIYGEESKDPKRIVPRATLIAVLGVGVFYVFVSWMAIAGNGLAGSVQVAQTDALAFIFNPTREYVGGWAVDVSQWLLVSGAFACGMAFHNCAARYLYAFGREGFIHPALGRTHRVHMSPHNASALQTALATAIIGGFWIFGQDPYASLFVLMAILGTMAILVVQTLCSLAVVVYFRRHQRQDAHWFRTLVAPVLGGIGMASVIGLLLSNLDTAAGAAAQTLLFELIPWLVVAVFAIGCGFALWLRGRECGRYDGIGRTVFGDLPEAHLEPGDLVPSGALATAGGRASL